MRREALNSWLANPRSSCAPKRQEARARRALVIDIPESFIGIIMETIGSRRGECSK